MLRDTAVFAATTWRGIVAAVRARPGTVAAVAALVVTLDVFLPPLLLSVTRKPWTFFMINPWLKRLPEYLVSDAPWSQKLDFLSRVALFWFQADGPYGAPEWGFAVDMADAVRFVVMALLIGIYVAVWRQAGGGGWRPAAGRSGGVLGACASVIGLSTGPCSVVGCGAPVLPVVALVFAELSSTTLSLLSRASRLSATVVLVVLVVAIVGLGRRVGAARPVPAHAQDQNGITSGRRAEGHSTRRPA